MNGVEHGLCREWYDNGQLWYEYNYVNGNSYGLCRGWYFDGQLRNEYNYVNGI